MALLEDRTAVFIVRIWCEHGDADAAAMPEWRGSVEHMESGQRVFFRNLEAVVDFMKVHLQSIGIDAQQRFWERIATVIDDTGSSSPQPSLLTAVPPASPPSITARKRR